MGTVASQITILTIVYTTVYSDADQSKHQSSASLAFVWAIHRGPVNSPHKWPVTRKMFPFDDDIMVVQMSPHGWPFLSCIVNDMVADDLLTKGAMVSTAMVSEHKTYFLMTTIYKNTIHNEMKL